MITTTVAPLSGLQPEQGSTIEAISTRSGMHTLEHITRAFRHNRWLGKSDWLWNRLRPPYDTFLQLLAPDGLERIINGGDSIRVLPTLRSIPENYEPVVWKLLMNEVRAGDVVADIGACLGVYTIAFANRTGAAGTVHAFEPDRDNFCSLSRHCQLNRVGHRVHLHNLALADHDGCLLFNGGRSSESHLGDGPNSYLVNTSRLDSVFSQGRIDIMKVDVEGFEESVLRGGVELLNDRDRRPRLIYVEVHPFAWSAAATTSESLLSLLASCRYAITDVSGNTIRHVETYGGILARKEGD